MPISRRRRGLVDPNGFPDTDFHNVAFDSPAAVLAEVERAMDAVERGGRAAWPLYTGNPWHAAEIVSSIDAGWYGGTRSLQDLKDVMQQGWPEGCRVIARLRAQVDHVVERVRERAETVAYDVAGQWLDMGRYVTGEPEAFGSMVQAPLGNAASKVIRIDLNTGVNAMVNQEAFLRKGAAAAALCDVLEASGRRVEIYTVAASVHHAGTMVPGAKRACNIRICLKSANEPLDFSRIAVAMAHVGFHRRVVLSLKQAIGQDPDGNRPCGYRYSALPSTQEHWRTKEDAIIFPETNLQYGDNWKAVLATALTQIGVDVENLFD